MNKLQALYCREFGLPADFYPALKARAASCPCEFIQHPGFSHGIPAVKQSDRRKLIETKIGDSRIDVPIWFGAIQSKRRIMIIGQEPHDTDSSFNLRRCKRIVFAAAFGADRWNPCSSVKGKPQNKYWRTFHSKLTNRTGIFLFTDAVKDFEIRSGKTKSQTFARRAFAEKLRQRWLSVLLSEISIIHPTHVIALGQITRKALSGFDAAGNCVHDWIPHPSNGGEKAAARKLYLPANGRSARNKSSRFSKVCRTAQNGAAAGSQGRRAGKKD